MWDFSSYPRSNGIEEVREMKRFGFISAMILLMGLMVSSGDSKEVVIRDPGDVVKENIKGIRIGEPIRYKNLSIFPLIHLNPKDRTPYLTLDEAVKKGCLVIEEVEGGSVPKVKVKNTSKMKIFLMAGEILTGCKQDRVVGSDILIPEKTTLTIPVYCSEQGRWSQKTPQFKGGGTNAPAKIREGIYKGEGQGWIWSQIDRLQRMFCVVSPTERLQEVYESEEVKEISRPYIDNLEDLPQLKAEGVVGIVATIGERIICSDIFCNENLFAKLYPKLLRSYVVDAIDPCAPKGMIEKEDVKVFIQGLFDARYRGERNPGLGELVSIEGEGISGKALLYRDAILHLSLFEEEARPIQNEGSLLGPDIRRQMLRD
jgi:hypothetical protein